MSVGRRFMCVSLLLSACQQPTSPSTTRGNGQNAAVADSATAASPPHQIATDTLGVPATPMSQPGERRSCATELGPAAAQRLADRCRATSPATHPPCHPSNSCALIEEEISRGCSMLGDDAAGRACGVLASDDGRAVAVIRRYYSAINARDFPTAYDQWGSDGQDSGKSFEAFQGGFAATRSVRVTIGSVGTIEGAVGSLYLDVPVRIEATLANGMHQQFIGTYVLRRVNNVDGAEPRQLLWHIASATLRTVR